VVRQHARITWLTNGNAAMVPVFPLVLAAPKYLAGDLSLGEVMQLASAFVQVQIAIGWLIDNYSRVAEWSASARRIVELNEAMADADSSEQDGVPLIKRPQVAVDAVELHELRLMRPSGEIVIERAHARFEPGDRIIVSGAAGVGKSSLLRSLAGLWLWGEGEIRVPHGKQVSYVAANPFLQAGRLSDIICFPRGLEAYSTAACLRALEICGADHLAERLDEVDHWEHVLSASEKQRVALARAWALQPRLLLLDEPTASLDPSAKRDVEQLWTQFLSDSGQPLLPKDLALAPDHPSQAADAPVSCVFSSHNLGQVKRLASRVIYLERGRILADLPVGEFFDSDLSQTHPQADLFLKGELR
jgi:putative ATP-binding cassette transporter